MGQVLEALRQLESKRLPQSPACTTPARPDEMRVLLATCPPVGTETVPKALLRPATAYDDALEPPREYLPEECARPQQRETGTVPIFVAGRHKNGTVPFGPPRASARPSPADVAGQSRAAGPYDDLAGMILAQVPAGSPAALGFTSVDECAGRSEMVALLAAALARREPRDVLAVDADFRRPPVSGSTHLGLAGVLDGRIAWEEAITETGIPSLFTLSAGCTDSGTDANGFPANGSPLSERLAPLLEPWRGRFRLVLVETPSLIWPESVRLARYFQSVYLAVRLGQTRQRALRHAVEAMEAAGGRLAGAILLKPTAA